MRCNDDLVSASEIVSWAWCPESWRLDALGDEPENRAALRRGEESHARTAVVERQSSVTLRAGPVLLLLAVVALAAYLLLGGLR
jgi:hypothetical protein